MRHKELIGEEDWKTLQRYLEDVAETTNMKKLTYYIWFHLTVRFCLRGGEVQAQLTKSDLEFTTVNGTEVLRLATSFMSKNHQGGPTGSDWSSAGVSTN